MKTKINALITLFLIAISANAQIDRSVQPKPGPAPVITLETPQEFELKNGLKVLVVENRKLPRVSYSLRIDNPPKNENEITGVSGILGAMMGNGTTNIPKDDFNEEIDFLGAFVSFGSSSAYGSSLSKYSERILELMADAVMHPLLTEEEFQKEKDKALEGLKASAKSVETIASRVGAALSYGKAHPYGEFTTEESLNRITLDDVNAIYQKNFNPNNAYLVVVGDVDFKTIKKQITKNFKNWEKSNIPTETIPEPQSNVSNTQINFIDMPNAVQSNVSVTSNVKLKMGDPDYHAVLIANKILGGGFNSYLNMNLREQHGYTYGARSNVGANRYGASRFTAGAAVRNAVTDSAVVESLKEIKRIKTEKVSDEDLKNAKAKYVGDFVLALERPQTIANYALNIKLNNLPDDFYKTYLSKINAVTADDVQRVANKYFTSEKARVIVVGKASEVLTNLEKTGLPINYYDTFANPTEKPELELKLPEGVNVKSVINTYFDAIGGQEKLDKINSLILKYEGSAMGSIVLSEEKKMAEKLAQNVYMNGAEVMAVVATKDEAFMKRGGARSPFPGTMGKDLSKIAGLFVEHYILNEPSLKINAIEDINGKAAYKIEIPGETVSYAMFYDVETGLKVKEEQTISMNGQSQVQAALLKDYKAYEGILFPETKEANQMGQTIISKLKEVKINSGVSNTDFE